MNLNEFIAAGSDFFKGNTIAKADHDRLIAEAKSAFEGQISTLTANVSALTEEISRVKSELEQAQIALAKANSDLQTANAKVAALPAAASAQAATIVATVGANSPVAATVTENSGVASTKDFPALVKAYMAENSTANKANAIVECARRFPTEHLAWLKAGAGKL